jgi:hypothetical protein
MGREASGKKFLQDIGRVRPEHEHLAMRHVDDAHEPKGNGKTQAHNQQNRSQAQAIKEIGHGITHLEIALNTLHSGGDGGLYLRILFLVTQVPQARQG